MLVNNAGGTGRARRLRRARRFFENALRLNVTAGVPALEPARIPKDGRDRGRRRDREHLVALGGHGADRASSALRRRQGRAQHDDAQPRRRAGAQGARERDLGRRGGDRGPRGRSLTDEELAGEFDRNTPMGRPGTVEDIAAAALYLASPASVLGDRQESRSGRRRHRTPVDRSTRSRSGRAAATCASFTCSTAGYGCPARYRSVRVTARRCWVRGRLAGPRRC